MGVDGALWSLLNFSQQVAALMADAEKILNEAAVNQSREPVDEPIGNMRRVKIRRRPGQARTGS